VPDRPEDVDAAFAAIAADLEREGVGSDLPDLDDATENRRGTADTAADTAADTVGKPDAAPMPQAGPPPAAWRGSQGEWDWSWSTDDDHYVPPEPPPLPRLRPLTMVALGLVLAGLVLLVLPGVIGLDPRIGTPIALAALLCGGGLLLLRIRQAPKDPGGGRDDGAQL
jgi:hypothetical protein